MSDELSRVFGAMDVIRGRMQAELEKLCERPEAIDVARAVADELFGCLDHLCNFESATDHNGTRHDIVDVTAELKQHMTEAFRRVTGKPYRCEVLRNMDHREGRRPL